MYDEECYSCKKLSPYDTTVGDYICYKHKRYGNTLYTYIGITTEVWFPHSINGSCRFITIKLLHSDDGCFLDEIGEEISINISNVEESENDDEFTIITKEQAIAKAL